LLRQVQHVLKIAKHENRKLVLRPIAEILDALDLIRRQHWIASTAARQGVDAEDRGPSMVMERHHALNWIARFSE
jgi:hypothetical protein